MSNTAPEIYGLPAGAVRDFTISFAGQLDPADSLSGTPTLEAEGLTVDNVRVSPAAIKFKALLVPAGQAVLCRVSGAEDGSEYTLTVTATTASSPTQTLVGYIRVVGTNG